MMINLYHQIKNFWIARKLKNLILLSFKIIELEPISEDLNIFYDNNYNTSQKSKDYQRAINSPSKYLTKTVVSKNKIEFYVHTNCRLDRVTYESFDKAENFLKSIINKGISAYINRLPYLITEQNSITQNSNTLDPEIFIRQIESQTFNRRDKFYTSEKFQEILTAFEAIQNSDSKYS